MRTAVWPSLSTAWALKRLVGLSLGRLSGGFLKWDGLHREVAQGFAPKALKMYSVTVAVDRQDGQVHAQVDYCIHIVGEEGALVQVQLLQEVK